MRTKNKPLSKNLTADPRRSKSGSLDTQVLRNSDRDNDEDMGSVRSELERLIGWFAAQDSNVGAVTRAQLLALFKSRRVVHQVVLESARKGLLTRTDDGYAITEKFRTLAITQAGFGADDSGEKSSTSLSEPVERLEGPAVVSSEPRLCDLRLNQLSAPHRRPRQTRSDFLETETHNRPFADHASQSHELGPVDFLETAPARYDEEDIPKGYLSEEVTHIQTEKRSLSNNILNRVRARSTERANKSKQGKLSKTEALKQRAKELAEAKARGEQTARPKPITTTLQDEADWARIQAIACEYEQALRLYKHNPYLKWQKNGIPPRGAYTTLLQAANIADDLGVDYATYVKAQFWALDKWARREPSLRDLALTNTKYPSAERVKMYLAEVKKGSVNPERNVCSPVRPAPEVSVEARMLQSERQLQRFMKNYGESEEQILCRFARGRSANLYFDREWLLENETYQRLMAEGKL